MEIIIGIIIGIFVYRWYKSVSGHELRKNILKKLEEEE